MLGEIKKGKSKSPRRVLLYGPHGVGKTTWASQAPSPLILCTEDGANDVGADRTPLLADVGQVMEWLSWLLTNEHEYKTLVLDTLDWLEPLIWNGTAKRHGKANIEDFGYGKGYLLALDGWNYILKTLDELRAVKQMAVVFLSHARIVKFADPTSDAYDRYEPDLHKLASSRIQEWCDEVLFARMRTTVVKEDQGFGRKRARGVGGDRVVHTCESASWLAKRRCVLPDELPLEFSAYVDALRAGNGNIDGVVVEGSSKRRKKEEVSDG